MLFKLMTRMLKKRNNVIYLTRKISQKLYNKIIIRKNIMSNIVPSHNIRNSFSNSHIGDC